MWTLVITTPAFAFNHPCVSSAIAMPCARVWPMAEIARRSPAGTVRLRHLLERLRRAGWSADISGVMPGQLRTAAPWAVVLELAAAGDGTLGG